MEMFGDSIPSSDGKWIYISMFTKRGGIFSLAERERKIETNWNTKRKHHRIQ